MKLQKQKQEINFLVFFKEGCVSYLFFLVYLKKKYKLCWSLHLSSDFYFLKNTGQWRQQNTSNDIFFLPSAKSSASSISSFFRIHGNY